MGRKRASKVPTAVEVPPKKKIDQWTAIENGEASAASSVLYVSPEYRPKTRNYDRLRRKTKKISDGNDAQRLLMNAPTLPPSSKKLTKNASDSSSAEIAEPTKPKEKKKKKSNMTICLDDTESTNKTSDLFLSRVSPNNRSVLNSAIAEPLDMESDGSVEGLEIDISKEKNQVSEVTTSSDDDVEIIECGVEDEDVDEMEDEEMEIEDEEVGIEDEEIEIEDEEVDIEDEEDDMEVEHETCPHGCEHEPELEAEEDAQEDEDEQEEENSSDDEASVVSDQDAMSDEEAELATEAVVKLASKKHKVSFQPEKVNFDNFPFTTDDSVETANRALSFILKNVDVETFFKDIYQKNVLVVGRSNPTYYGNLFTTKSLSQMLAKNDLEYTKNVNIADYKNGVRTTLNGVGHVYPHVVKEHLENGRSVQIVNPQAYDDRIWYLCEILQELFHCFVGANTYLTPAGSSGFAPHWDDIDAFLLQTEGRKYWRVWGPQTRDDALPRESSGNFTEDDMKGRKPDFEGWLNAGDLLYIPRGFIHQASTCKEIHSLHVTISTGRKWSFADLLDNLVPEAVNALAEQRKKLRQGLPVGLFDMAGVADLDYNLDEHFAEKFAMQVDRHLSMLRNKITDELMDCGVDFLAKQFFKQALPPKLTPKEISLSAAADNLDLLDGDLISFDAKTRVRLIRRHTQRLLFVSDDECYIAHRLVNSRNFEAKPEQIVDYPSQAVEVYSYLHSSYPEWRSLEKIMSDKRTRKVPRRSQLAAIQLLFASGLLLVKNSDKKSSSA